VLVVERWAELRRLHFVGKVSIKELARRFDVDRNTVRRALRSAEPPRYERRPPPSKLDPFKDEIHRLLHDDPRLPNVRVRELIAEHGYAGKQTILDAYLREVRPLFAPAVRTYQRTAYRPGELAQFDLWEPRRDIPVGFGQSRRGYVVVGALGFSRIGAGALVFSKEAPDLLWAQARCLRSFAGLPETLVTDREGALHAGDGRPTDAYAAFCGQLKVSWRFCEAGDPEAKGVVERLIQFLETSFEPGRRFAGPLDFQEQLDQWFARRANVRVHRALR
jgi:transposase